MTIAVNPKARQPAEIFQALSDSSDDLLADSRVLFLERLGDETASLHGQARLYTQPIDCECRSMAKRRAVADGVYARERAA